jgi:hypothetical protein
MNHAYSRTCNCPGCSFQFNAELAYAKFGPPPVIGSFEPMNGDIGRDSEDAASQHRIWTGESWWPAGYEK